MNVAVLGAGSWGTTLAVHLANKGGSVRLWEVSQELAQALIRQRENVKFLPSIRIPESVFISSSLDEVIGETEVVVIAVPSHVMREVVKKVAGIKPRVSVISVAKGIEDGSLMRMSEVITEEVSRGIPTTVVVSSRDRGMAGDVQKLFMTENFRVYTNPDLVGVELGGALKNIIAIAAGISDGLGFGDNTKAALLTRGLAEITRLGVAMGANAGTFSGLSGMGDLITTCASPYSRNRKLGELVARGRAADKALCEVGQVAEGFRTTRCAHKLGGIHKVDVPITEQVHAVLFNGKDARSAASDLMLRAPRAELEEGFLGG
jgi:glycerol-3-phosphate dehydrogenase (NAD(P)+)